MTNDLPLATGFIVRGGAVFLGDDDTGQPAMAVRFAFRVAGSDEPVSALVLLDENGARDLVRQVVSAVETSRQEHRAALKMVRNRETPEISGDLGQGEISESGAPAAP